MLVPGNGYRVSSKFVADGDTLNLDYNGYQFAARLQWIDAPETQKNHTSVKPEILSHWKWAARSRTAAIDFINNRSLIAVVSQKDQFDRWLTDLYVDRISAANNLQIQLCKQGLAVSYLPFNRYQFNTRELVILRGIITETASAARKKVGIWSESNFLMPADFKKLTSY
ncbi:MAG: thermonuclease family protein [Oscillatoriaceae cyanobacterium Prado104]|jgi:endonuclease YncB( thermonuclease family)|nr:thermonuclease family protein [Oscillatoriaceae cyanobacterium Prado104]